MLEWCRVSGRAQTTTIEKGRRPYREMSGLRVFEVLIVKYVYIEETYLKYLVESVSQNYPHVVQTNTETEHIVRR